MNGKTLVSRLRELREHLVIAANELKAAADTVDLLCDEISTNSATEGQSDKTQHNQSDSTMLTVGQVAELLACSDRHVYRLEEQGLMPRAVRLGANVRWSRGKIESWIEAGCPGQ